MTARTAGIAIRMWGWAAVLRPLKHVVPLGTLVRLAHTRSRSLHRSPEFERRLEGYLEATAAFPDRAPANCLERSLGAYRQLCAANAAPTLVVGVRRSEALGVEGHVWVVVDGKALAERDVTSYTQILTFDSDACQHASDGSAAMLSGIRFA